jgi:hypothetical protein
MVESTRATMARHQRLRAVGLLLAVAGMAAAVLLYLLVVVPA